MDKEQLFSILDKSLNLSDIAFKLFGNKNYSSREKCKKILLENGINWKEWLATKTKRNFCLYCGKEIIGKERLRKKFCNSSCAASFNNKKKEKQHKTCLFCKKIIKRGLYCNNTCSFKHKTQEYIKRWQEGKETGMTKCQGIIKAIRLYILEKNNYACQKCGFNKRNEYTNKPILQIHHIDGDCTNNREDNLELLCPNCHALTENFGSRNKNATRVDRRTKRYRNL